MARRLPPSPAARSERGLHTEVDDEALLPYPSAHLLPARWTDHLDSVPGRVFLLMRTLVLIDGQNLYHLARIAWAPMPPDRSSPYSWPSYDVDDLAATLVARMPQRTLSEIRFYTGVPAPSVNQFWHYFWTNKCRRLRNQGVHVYTGRVNSAGQEKGVDVSLALDLIQATHEQRYEVAIIVSQDADFGPAVRLAKNIARSQKRHLLFESALPVGPGSISTRGVPGTTWTHIDRATYDACRDPPDYRQP